MSSGFWEFQVGNVGLCLKITFHFSDEETDWTKTVSDWSVAFELTSDAFCTLKAALLNN